VTEEELIALYAIARDELDGVKSACERLEKSVRRLENTGNNIDANAENGIRSVLKGFDNQVVEKLEKHLTSSSRGLLGAVEEAKRELRYVYWYKMGWSFIFGLMLGGGGLWWFTWDKLNELYSGQNIIYREIQQLKSHPKIQKPKMKHKKSEPTQSGEAASEEG
jgi:hypothetical protein